MFTCALTSVELSRSSPVNNRNRGRMGVPSLSLSDYAIGELFLIERGRQFRQNVSLKYRHAA